MKYLKVLVSSILAGAFIAFGGLGFILCKYYLPNAGQLVGACVFPFGLYLVCVLSLHLFTGKVGYVFDEKNEIKSRAIDLPIIFLGNFIGAALFGLAAYVMYKDNTDLMNLVEKICVAKEDANIWVTFLKANLCGVHVFLGVCLYKKADNPLFKFLGVFIAIFFFVLFGYEHCVANSFYFTFGLEWDLKSILNIIIGIIGNSTGAWIFWLALKFYESKKEVKNIEEKDL